MSRTPWILVGTAGAGLLNYLFGLAMAALLRPAQYSVFAGANAVILVMGTIANAAVPWLLARQILAREQGQADRGEVRAALILNSAEGTCAGAVAALAVVGFAGLEIAIWVGVATLGFFVASTAMGWAQGHERYALLAGLVVAEVLIRIVSAGALIGLGGGPAGAYMGTLVGAGVIFIGMLPLMWSELRTRALKLDLELWRTALSTAAIQAVITVLSVADVLFVTTRFHAGPTTATYQVAATLARTASFVAMAFSTEAFASLTRSPGDGRIISAELDRILGVLAPLTVVVMTLPGFLLDLLPVGYRGAGPYMPIVAMTGAAYSLVIIQSTPFRAAGRMRPCLLALLAGLTTSVISMVVGAQAGVTGLAVGAAVGAWATVLGLSVATERAWPGAARPRLGHLGPWLAVGGCLFWLRGVPALWCVLAAGCAVAVLSRAIRPSGEAAAR